MLKGRYTQEEIKRLIERTPYWGGLFLWDDDGRVSLEDLLQERKLDFMSYPQQSLLHTAGKVIFEMPLEELPLYISAAAFPEEFHNEEREALTGIILWRLEVGR